MHQIKIGLSDRKPFVILNENELPKGLGVTIVENFAKKYNLQTDYLIINSTTNNIFANESNFERFSEEMELKYSIYNLMNNL